jgi:hypothetical protein
MSAAKPAAAVALVALAVSACGTSSKPLAGTPGATAKNTGRGVVDDPRKKHLNCLREHHVPATEVGTAVIQVGAPPNGPTITFAPTPGAAQADQIVGRVQNAEVIGSALLAPNGASDQELKVLEDCMAQGVGG